MYKNRIDHLRDLLKKDDLDGLFITNPKNIYYLTGLNLMGQPDREATLFVSQDTRELFIPKMYENEAQEVLGFNKIILNRGIDLFEKPKESMKEMKRVGFESNDIRFNEFEIIQKDNKCELIPQKGLIESIRVVKDEFEIEIIKKVMKITTESLKNSLRLLKKGMSEKDFALVIKREIESLGGEGNAFETIVASGENSAKPHHRSSNKTIDDGILLIDMGASLHGYKGDLTRTFYLGKPDKLFQERYELVLKANQQSIKKCETNMSFSSIYDIAVEALGSESEHFTKYHTLGHGIGLDVHEKPIIHKESSDLVLENTIFTIEPGIYYPGWGGIRIEDSILNHKDTQVLTEYPYEFLV